MITVGKYLKDFRQKKRLSKKKLSTMTKIRESFIDAIENEEWNKLPESTVVAGFVKNIASVVGANTLQAAAFFRRDYKSTRNAKINPSPDLPSKFVWNPRLAFSLGLIAVFALVLIYLIIQYINFSKPPQLTIEYPTQGQIVEKNTVEVTGKTDVGVTLIINNQPVIVEEDGSFFAEIMVSKDIKTIKAKSVSRSGKETILTRDIEVVI